MWYYAQYISTAHLLWQHGGACGAANEPNCRAACAACDDDLRRTSRVGEDADAVNGNLTVDGDGTLGGDCTPTVKDGDVATWYVGVLDGREVTKPGVRFTDAAGSVFVVPESAVVPADPDDAVYKPDVPRRRARGRRTTRASGTGCAIRRSTSRRVSTVGIAARRRARVTRAVHRRRRARVRRSRRRSRHGVTGSGRVGDVQRRHRRRVDVSPRVEGGTHPRRRRHGRRGRSHHGRGVLHARRRQQPIRSARISIGCRTPSPETNASPRRSTITRARCSRRRSSRARDWTSCRREPTSRSCSPRRECRSTTPTAKTRRVAIGDAGSRRQRRGRRRRSHRGQFHVALRSSHADGDGSAVGAPHSRATGGARPGRHRRERRG